MITSETFYRAECDRPGCGITLPDDENDSGTHWPRASVVEALAEERGQFDETWTVVGEQTFCPRHRPGNVDCTACEDGYLRAERPGPREPGMSRWEFSKCPICDGRGYLAVETPDGQEKSQ